MKPSLRKKTPDTHKELHFRDKSVVFSRILIIMAAIIFGVATALLSFTLRQGLARQDEMKQIIGLAEAQGGNITVARQIYDVMQKVARMTKLPDDELPVFASIADVTKLQEQSVFQQAMNGDQILFYTKSQKIYIYRPKTNTLVAQGPFALAPQPEQQTPPPDVIPLQSVPDQQLPPMGVDPAALPEASPSATQ